MPGHRSLFLRFHQASSREPLNAHAGRSLTLRIVRAQNTDTVSRYGAVIADVRCLVHERVDLVVIWERYSVRTKASASQPPIRFVPSVNLRWFCPAASMWLFQLEKTMFERDQGCHLKRRYGDGRRSKRTLLFHLNGRLRPLWLKKAQP